MGVFQPISCRVSIQYKNGTNGQLIGSQVDYQMMPALTDLEGHFSSSKIFVALILQKMLCIS